ncbi:hypothetical protein [Accumulibacter sp.]|uniref:hypothetical protein n=1 Tax=Accumulibacter sp. TaxID=2053492 RepID=UPI002879F9DD|nr:hypothetical protein [Accumulibacter sp.]MDS4055658.1 hypothetical protein [Accumulibacter sp.]
MADVDVVAALISKRAELADLIEHQEKETRRLPKVLAHIEATVKLFSPDFELRTVAKARPVRNRFFGPGECQRMVLDIFREAQGAALSSRQIGEALAARKALEPSTALIEQMQKNALNVVHRLQRTGTLVAAGRDGPGATWTVG